MEPHKGVTYRWAHCLADQLREARWLDMQHGRHRTNPAAGGAFAAILAEVRRRLRLEGDDAPEAEPVRLGVEDALARRRPRW
jgi:hypothetical protein